MTVEACHSVDLSGSLNDSVHGSECPPHHRGIGQIAFEELDSFGRSVSPIAHVVVDAADFVALLKKSRYDLPHERPARSRHEDPHILCRHPFQTLGRPKAIRSTSRIRRARLSTSRTQPGDPLVSNPSAS